MLTKKFWTVVIAILLLISSTIICVLTLAELIVIGGDPTGQLAPLWESRIKELIAGLAVWLLAAWLLYPSIKRHMSPLLLALILIQAVLCTGGGIAIMMQASWIKGAWGGVLQHVLFVVVSCLQGFIVVMLIKRHHQFQDRA